MFHVVPSNKQEILTQVLISFIQDDFKRGIRGVFEPTTILVESQGMQHYLNMEIAKQTGLSMNIQFPLVSREIYNICRLVLGDTVPEDSPYKREYLVWNIFTILQDEAFISDPRSTYANAYWQNQSESLLQCFRLAKQLADVYEQYLIYRADWLATWEQGGLIGLTDTLEPWQQMIWERLVEIHPNHPAALRASSISQLSQHQDKLPSSIIIFAVNTLSPTQIEFFSALAQYTDVYLFFLNPCSQYWGDVISDKALLRQRLSQGIEELVAEDLSHPILANLGQQGRGLFNQLQDIHYPDMTDSQLFIAPAKDSRPNLLQQVQADIASAQVTPVSISLEDLDSSIQIHSCFSAIREVQTLHDELLRVLKADPNLQPHDILVMCPSVEDYAPFVNSIFRPSYKPAQSDSPQLVCSIADRAPLNSEPSVMMFLDMLSLPDSRFSVTKIIDYLRIPHVQNNLNLTQDELSLVINWLSLSQIKWGLNQEHKATWVDNQDVTEHYTWEWGLSRLALGCLHSERQDAHDHFAYIDEVEGLNSRILGKLLVLVNRLSAFRDKLNGDKPIEQWESLLKEMSHSLFGGSTAEQKAEQVIEQVISQLTKQVKSAGYASDIGLAIVRESLSDKFSTPDALNQFLTGQVTFSSMVPMRSVPFKMICILGLNDGAFPRIAVPNSIDLIAQSEYVLGDRSRRNEDRYLFLEAMISARDYLYLSYQGQSVKDNQVIEPSLVIQELLHYLDQKFVLSQDETTSETNQSDKLSTYIVQRAPLQPFSTTLFASQDADFEQTGSFDQGWLALAKRNVLPAKKTAITIPDEIYLDQKELTTLFTHPLKLHVNKQYDVVLDEYLNVMDDVEPFSLDGLAKDKLLAQALCAASDNSVTDHLHETGLDFLTPLISSGDVSQWMLHSQQIRLYEGLQDTISTSLSQQATTPDKKAHMVEWQFEHYQFHLNALFEMDNDYHTHSFLPKVLTKTRVLELRLSLLFTHCLKLMCFGETGDTSVRYLNKRERTQEGQKTAYLEVSNLHIPHDFLTVAQANTVLMLFSEQYIQALRQPHFIHLDVYQNLESIRLKYEPDIVTHFSQIPHVEYLLDDYGEQREDPFSPNAWNINTYCKWLFPHGFSHQDIALDKVDTWYFHPIIQVALLGKFDPLDPSIGVSL